ncbi:MAG: hypothetical protein COV99_11555 [Bacteroidetes bacterium CG12_big_fil_rev_8_21_14_0_65_60_17]|nr:MAG: hypothetical protein COV99_11555 [Bacteroidetes bacterium CG12_big_fil_rev_8_21_14_0_65_60_17]
MDLPDTSPGNDTITIMKSMNTTRVALLSAALLLLGSGLPALAQLGIEQPPHPPPPGERGSPNITVLSHIPLGAAGSVSDIEIEQEMDRPYAYVARRVDEIGFDIIDLSNPEQARVIHRWRIEDQELHVGGAMDGRYFGWEGRIYYVQSVQLRQSGPNSDVGAIVFDVTDLPESFHEVGRIRQSETPGGFHNIFMYEHSGGKPLLFATSGQHAKVFDMARFVDRDQSEMEDVLRDENRELVGMVPVAQSENMWSRGYHDFMVQYHAESGQDRFYGGGGSGFYVYDVTDPGSPNLLTKILDVPGVSWGHTFTPTPDGNFAVGETEFQYQPLRIFDLRPGLSGEVDKIDHAVGYWQADWRALAHNHEMRWPYVFVSGYETGLGVFNMADPANPYTVAYYDTYNGVHNDRQAALERLGSPYTWNVYDGAWGVDVRNADGLIVISDMTTGFWAFRMDGFNGWNGEDWGMPNESSAQRKFLDD